MLVKNWLSLTMAKYPQQLQNKLLRCQVLRLKTRLRHKTARRNLLTVLLNQRLLIPVLNKLPVMLPLLRLPVTLLLLKLPHPKPLLLKLLLPRPKPLNNKVRKFKQLLTVPTLTAPTRRLRPTLLRSVATKQLLRLGLPTKNLVAATPHKMVNTTVSTN